MPTSPVVWTIVSVCLVSAISLIGVGSFVLQEQLIRRSLLIFVSFSTGALFGDVFLHMIPEMADPPDQFGSKLLLILGGILLSFVIEKFIHWRHCHCSALPTEEGHIHPVGIMNLVGDGLHNFLDGALIAGSFLINPTVGVATTVAVILHEIPQEIGDFAILLLSGFQRGQALLFNLLSGTAAIAGAVMVLLSATTLPFAGEILLPIAAGNFLYLAGSDLIPELHKETRIRQALMQLLCILAGIGVMLVLKIMGEG